MEDQESVNYIFYKIQKIDDDTMFYIGSTKDFNERKWKHKSDCYNANSIGYTYNLYKTIRENGGWDCFTMTEMDCKYLTKRESKILEQEWIDKLNPPLNTHRAYRGEEYMKKYMQEYKKKYKKKNKEHYKQVNKQYREQNKERIQEYREQHKEHLNQLNKQYREQNKEKINCECGGKYTLLHKKGHLKTKLHLKYSFTI